MTLAVTVWSMVRIIYFGSKCWKRSANVDAEGLVVQCTESLKNVILVLLSQHHFEAMTRAAGHDTLHHTWNVLKDSMPQLREHVEQSTSAVNEIVTEHNVDQRQQEQDMGMEIGTGHTLQHQQQEETHYVIQQNGNDIGNGS